MDSQEQNEEIIVSPTKELSKPTGYVSNINQDKLIEAQENKIAEDIRASHALIGPLEGLESLRKEFENDPVYSGKVKSLESNFCNIRRTRPDGNCFLRGFIFAYLDYCVQNRHELTRFKKYLEASKSELLDMGFPRFTTEDFYDMFIEVMNDLEGAGTQDRVVSICNDAGGRTVEEFCKQEVEPMYRECDHLHIVALTAALNVSVCVMYLDRGKAETVASHNFPEDREPIFYLLYRPNHYDLLYKT